jgi:hypothetical protein
MEVLFSSSGPTGNPSLQKAFFELAYLTRGGGMTAGNPITLEARKTKKEAALAKPPLLPGVFYELPV